MLASGQRVPRFDVRFGAADDLIPHLQAQGRQDVALLAVLVVQQRNPGRAVGVVLDGGHLGRHLELVPLEIDDPIQALVSAAPVPGSAPADVVSAPRFLEGLEQASFRLDFADLAEIRDRLEAPSRGGWFAWYQSHINTFHMY